MLTGNEIDFIGLTRTPLTVKDGGAKRLQSSPWSQGMNLGVFSRMFPSGYGSHSQSQCCTSSHRLSEVCCLLQKCQPTLLLDVIGGAILASRMPILSFMPPVWFSENLPLVYSGDSFKCQNNIQPFPSLCKPQIMQCLLVKGHKAGGSFVSHMQKHIALRPWDFCFIIYHSRFYITIYLTQNYSYNYTVLTT